MYQRKLILSQYYCIYLVSLQILKHILIPCFQHAFKKNEGEKLIGGPPTPDQDNPENIISAFITKIIDPENPFGTSDSVRILLLQLSSLLVEQASSHIHDANNKQVMSTGFYVVKLFRLSSCSCCKNFMLTGCSYQSIMHS